MWPAATGSYVCHINNKTVLNSHVDIANTEGQLQYVHTAILIAVRTVHCILLVMKTSFTCFPSQTVEYSVRYISCVSEHSVEFNTEGFNCKMVNKEKLILLCKDSEVI